VAGPNFENRGPSFQAKELDTFGLRRGFAGIPRYMGRILSWHIYCSRSVGRDRDIHRQVVVLPLPVADDPAIDAVVMRMDPV
jgi:hypothetical protein